MEKGGCKRKDVTTVPQALVRLKPALWSLELGSRRYRWVTLAFDLLFA